MNITDVVNYYLSFGISSPYNENRGTYSHKGIDFNLAGNQDLGKPVYSMINGVVKRTGYQKDGAGNYIVIGEEMGNMNHNEIKFFHLQDKPLFNQGDQIKVGDIIGYIGNSGKSTGAHLHMETWNEQGKTINPLDYLKNLLNKTNDTKDFFDIKTDITDLAKNLNQDQTIKFASIGLAAALLFSLLKD